MPKKIIFISLFLIFFFENSNADNKERILNELKTTESIVFDFIKITNQIEERGECYLLFHSKLKCIYNDKKLKELIINDTKLAITQKRYNKTYFYPLNKSPFLKILKKKELLKLISLSDVKEEENILYFNFKDKNNQDITILFNKISLNLKGWVTKDQFNNDINFFIKIKSKNLNFKKNFFQIPKN